MSRKALVLVDVQYDFLPPNGSLPVPDGNSVLPCIYDLLEHSAKNYEVIAASQDWHPVGHVSFASTHSMQPFIEIQVPKLHEQGATVKQMLWPDHCVQETPGSRIEQGVQARLDALDPKKVHYIRKGENRDVDAYSAFADNAYTIFSPLAKVLHGHEITEVDVAGLALDYCVKYTAVDSCKFEFKTRVLRNATRATDVSGEGAESVLQQWGVQIV